MQIEQGPKLCLGAVVDEKGDFFSYGTLVGPKILFAAFKDSRLRVQWHEGEEHIPIVPIMSGLEGFALYRLEKEPARELYDPPLPLWVSSAYETLRVHWGIGSAKATVIVGDVQRALYVSLNPDPKRALLAAPVLSGIELLGAIGARMSAKRDDLYPVITFVKLFEAWRSQPQFPSIRAELFWDLDQILKPQARPSTEENAASKATVEMSSKATSKVSKERPKRRPTSASKRFLDNFTFAVMDALAWANAMAQERQVKIDAHLLFVGMMLHRPSQGYRDAAQFLWDYLDGHKPRGVKDPIDWFGLHRHHTSENRPYAPLQISGTTELDETAVALLQSAIECAQVVSREAGVSMRHLVGALLLGPNSFRHAQAGGLIGETGLNFKDLGAKFLVFIVEAMPSESVGWTTWVNLGPVDDAQADHSRYGADTTTGEDIYPKPGLAGYHADLPNGIDQLDIEDEVQTLCSVILDQNHPPPLSIGLFGDWGSGKSFFLGKMKDRIDKLTADAREAQKREMKTVFVGRAPQIEFNAWHFVDANLWASLVTHLLAELHVQIFGRKPTAEEEKAEQLYKNLETTEKRVEALRREGRAADELVIQATNSRTQAENDLRTGKRIIEIFRRLSADSVKELILFPETENTTTNTGSQSMVPENRKAEVRTRLEDLSKTLRKGKQSAEELQSLAEDLLTTAGRFSRFARESWVLLLIVAALAGLGMLLMSPVGTRLFERLYASASGVAAMLAATAMLAQKAGPYLSRAKRFLQAAEATRQEVLSESQSKLTQAEIARKDAADRLAVEEGRRQSLLKEIEEARRGLGVEGFLQQRLGDSTYKAQLGIVAMVRQDFDTLTKRLRETGIEIADPKTRETTRRETVDRVILYIDDLDRCPPDRVVEVLQAVHLLCAIPLFVVVVAADPRWLVHSLHKHYAELLHTQEGSGREVFSEEAAHWESTPLQYLEKIFQIPYTLPPMNDDGFRKLVKSLLAPKRGETDTSTKEHQEDGSTAQEQPNEHEAGVLQNVQQAHQGQGAGLGDPKSQPRDPIKPGSPPEATSTTVQVPLAAQQKNENEKEKEDPKKKEWKPSFDLTPSQLGLSTGEQMFLEELSSLVATPRSTKRLVNVYRLLRANLRGTNYARFEGGEYRAVQTLLGILIGFPDHASELFVRLRAESPSGDFWRFVKTEKNNLPNARNQSRDRNEKNTDREASKGTVDIWTTMCEAVEALEKVCDEAKLDRTNATFARWIDEVSRYSFRAGHELRNLLDEKPAVQRDRAKSKKRTAT